MRVLPVLGKVADETGTAACPYPPKQPPSPEITYTSFIPHRAVIGKRLKVGAKCSIACTATATGRLKISRNRFRKAPAFIQLKAVTRSLAPEVRGNLVFSVPSRRVPKIKKAIRNGSRVTVRVTVKMVGEDSSGGSGCGCGESGVASAIDTPSMRRKLRRALERPRLSVMTLGIVALVAPLRRLLRPRRRRD